MSSATASVRRSVPVACILSMVRVYGLEKCLGKLEMECISQKGSQEEFLDVCLLQFVAHPFLYGPRPHAEASLLYQVIVGSHVRRCTQPLYQRTCKSAKRSPLVFQHSHKVCHGLMRAIRTKRGVVLSNDHVSTLSTEKHLHTFG